MPRESIGHMPSFEQMPSFILLRSARENRERRQQLERKLKDYRQRLNDYLRHGWDPSRSSDPYQWYGLNCLIFVLERVLEHPDTHVRISDLSFELNKDPERWIWARYSSYGQNPLSQAFRKIFNYVSGQTPIRFEAEAMIP